MADAARTVYKSHIIFALRFHRHKTVRIKGTIKNAFVSVFEYSFSAKVIQTKRAFQTSLFRKITNQSQYFFFSTREASREALRHLFNLLWDFSLPLPPPPSSFCLSRSKRLFLDINKDINANEIHNEIVYLPLSS